MTPEQMAATHAKAFTDLRPWKVAEFENLLGSPMIFACGDPRSFALGRAVANEAELLTLATDPTYQRQGLARIALEAFETEAHNRGARTAFLEVAADNAPAISLYEEQGYSPTARRQGYYRNSAGLILDGLVYFKSLRG